jgi:hypothetical protein
MNTYYHQYDGLSGGSMTNIDRKYLVSLDRKAADLQKIWLSERNEKRTIQIAANAEIRRRWFELDSIEDETTPDDQESATAEQADRRSHASRP